MKTRLIRALARLASSEYQKAYLVKGTPAEYVVAEDLLDDILSLGELAEREQYKQTFTSAQAAKLEALVQIVEAVDTKLLERLRNTSPDEFIRNDSEWRIIRCAAAECLREFGVDAAQLHPDEIDRL